eukprot:6201053-Pleurochrysis_carterae.AAC.1
MEDGGPVSDLLSVDITRDADCVLLQQHKYMAHLVETYDTDGAPYTFHKMHAPASDDLPKLVDEALAAKLAGVLPPPELKSTYQSL